MMSKLKTKIYMTFGMVCRNSDCRLTWLCNIIKAKYLIYFYNQTCRSLIYLSKIKRNTYNREEEPIHMKHRRILWGKPQLKNPTICIIIQGGNISELHKALALTASQLWVQSSWMLTGKQGFSQTFFSALQASYFLAVFLLGDPTVTKCNTDHSNWSHTL